ncbi:MAG: 30S ribosomal protein S1, partial [Chloroflexaceae bacterium]|nr:30S ribosomal protein S1 [Chloroflexaceae bacterium]
PKLPQRLPKLPPKLLLHRSRRATAEGDEAEGASFTPVAEDEEVRPRRLKDLSVGMELEGRVTSIALYGVFVDVGVGRDGLVHISEMSNTRIESPSDMVQIGDTVQVRVKGIDLDARRISLTMRSRDEEDRGRRRRPEVDRGRLGDLKVGDVVEGTITGLASFGAFVDIGVGKDGLVHVSELAEGRVEKSEDAVQVGETYPFKILEVDPEGTRISLSLRRALRSRKMQQLTPGQMLDGTISGLAPFGAFVDIGVGRDGLVHISQLSEQRVNKVEDVVKVGDKVQVRVLEVDSQSKRISLSMRPEAPEQPEESASDEGASEPSSEASSAADRNPRVPTQPASPPSRFTLTPEQREEARQRERGARRRDRERGPRSDSAGPPRGSDVVYATEDDADDDFEGNATLEDLLNKFGGGSRSKGRRQNEEEDETDEDERTVQQQKQRDAIRRTLRREDDDDA